MKFYLVLAISMVCSSPLFAAQVDTARVAGDLKVEGIHFSKDGSTLESSTGFLKENGTWDGAVTYSAGAVVQHLGSSYVAVTASLNQSPPNVAFWSILAAQGTSGLPGPPGPPGTSGITQAVSESGEVSSTLTADSTWQMVGGRSAITITTAGQKVFVTSTAAIGTTAETGAGSLDLDICFVSAGVVYVSGFESLYSIRTSYNTRHPYSLSVILPNLAPGSYEVGMCARTSDPNWNSNDFGYSSALVF